MSGRGPKTQAPPCMGTAPRSHSPASRPMVMAPPLPVKNRPLSTGPDKQGVTPTTRVGALRGCPSSSSPFTQPLNQELLTATCGGERRVRAQDCIGWAGAG